MGVCTGSGSGRLVSVAVAFELVLMVPAVSGCVWGGVMVDVEILELTVSLEIDEVRLTERTFWGELGSSGVTLE